MENLITNLSDIFTTQQGQDRVQSILNVLETTHLSINDYIRWVKHPPAAHYSYSTIYSNDDYELLLLTWLPFQRTNTHPHLSRDGQDSQCWYKIIKGEMDEYIFYNNDEIKKNRLKTNHVSYIHNSIGKHKMANDERLSISLHVYSPPLRTNFLPE